VITTTPSLALVTTTNGSYYMAGNGDVAVTAGEPVQPQVVVEAHLAGTVVHGVLWLGGTFTRTTGFDPLVARLTSSDGTGTEPDFSAPGWTPPVPVTLSRLEGSAGLSEDLLSTPGQYDARLDQMRVYSQVLYQTYHAPESETDFTPPSITQVSSDALTVSVRVSDASDVVRVPVLWRAEGETAWHLLDLQNAGGGTWSGAIPYPGDGPALYLVQALDGAGNVSFQDDAGYEFSTAVPGSDTYLPIIVKGE
jgi:hypothetical protein